jgi:phosphoserine phosphatase RsbU/P
MSDQVGTQSPLRLAGYDSWLYQKPCFDSIGDVFVSLPLPTNDDLLNMPPRRWLVAVGDICGRDEAASRLKDSLETEVARLAMTTSDPALILETLNNDPGNRTSEIVLATLLVAVIDTDRHELTVANAGIIAPLVRHADRRIESLAEEIAGFPLWFDPGQTYEHVTAPVAPGEVARMFSDGVSTVSNHTYCLFSLHDLREAIAQASDDPASVGQSLLDAIGRFRGDRPQPDDITLFCLGRFERGAPLSGRAPASPS